MISTEKYIKNILLTKVIAFGLPILRRLKTNMQDRKLPRKQGTSKKYVNIVFGIVICSTSSGGLMKTGKGRASLSSGGHRVSINISLRDSKHPPGCSSLLNLSLKLNPMSKIFSFYKLSEMLKLASCRWLLAASI